MVYEKRNNLLASAEPPCTIIGVQFILRIFAMYEQRMAPRRRGPSILSCLAGCLIGAVILIVVGIIAVVVLLPRIPSLAARVAGLDPRGETAAVFTGATPAPTIQLQDSSQPAQITINMGEYGGVQTLDTSDYQVEVGADSTGAQAAVATFSEADLFAICQQHSPLCDGSDPRFKNPRIDLRPGGAIFYADASIPNEYNVDLTQTVGVVMKLDDTSRQFQFAGIDIGGELFDNPPAQFADTVDRMQQGANTLLTQVTVDAGNGQALTVAQISIDDNNLTLVLR